jgi:hypothetical protein
LEKHQQWLGQHQELYAQAVKGCERSLKRQAFVAACKQKALLPIQLVATASIGLLQAMQAYPRRSLEANLKDAFRSLISRAFHRQDNFRSAFRQWIEIGRDDG